MTTAGHIGFQENSITDFQKRTKNIAYVKVLPKHMNIHIFDPENKFHSYMHILICPSSFFPEIPMNGVYVVSEMLCRRFFGVFCNLMSV